MKKSKNYCTYIMTNYTNKVLYVGISGNLFKRAWEHKHKLIEGFTKRYNINKLIYYECFNNPNDAIKREKEIKGWKRNKKINLIKIINPKFEDLSQNWKFPDLIETDSSRCSE
ncbi:MAG: GIY-YIG nuclease family protein [Patescibacteria group bacterium]